MSFIGHYIAQTERKFIRIYPSAIAEGIASAKARGVKFGREKIDLPDDFETAKEKFISRELTVHEAAELCGINCIIFYNYVINCS